VTQQAALDKILIDLDGTPLKSRLGANALLAVSLAVAKSGGGFSRRGIIEYLAGTETQFILPCR